jgi:hypothetical protein
MNVITLPLARLRFAAFPFVAILLTTSLSFSQSSTQTNITVTNLQGRVYSNVNVLKIEKDGILFRYGDEFRYDRIKFTNMSEAVQLQFGYCMAIAEQRTNIVDSLTQQATELLIFEEKARRNKLHLTDTSGPVFYGLDEDQIKTLFAEFIKTNSPPDRQLKL